MLVQQHLDAARTQVPEIPHPGSLNVIQGNYLINMMFDNVVVDMIMQGWWKQQFGRFFLQKVYSRTLYSTNSTDLSDADCDWNQHE
jgi:hypothetical protein